MQSDYKESVLDDFSSVLTSEEDNNQTECAKLLKIRDKDIVEILPHYVAKISGNLFQYRRRQEKKTVYVKLS